MRSSLAGSGWWSNAANFVSRRLIVSLLAIYLLPICVGCYVDNAPPIAKPVEVTLGDPELTAGIPGEGRLTSAEIERWLANESNHATLEITLPPHLSEAAASVSIPSDNPLTRAKIELGRQLFFEPRLSHNGAMMCADCHYPAKAFTMYLGNPAVTRDPLPAINRILSTAQFWDGHAADLRQQPLTPIKNAHEMNTTPEQAAARIEAIDGYRMQLERIYGSCDFEAVCMALASFQRALVTGPSAWDHARMLRAFDPNSIALLSPEQAAEYQRLSNEAELNPMSESALRGESLFFSERLNCGQCHSGPNLSDEQFHNLGIGMERDPPESGRMAVTNDSADLGAIKTPSLRNVARTEPYMHDGRFNDLARVIDWFDKGGYENPHQSPLIGPLGLSDNEKADLIAFLISLNSEVPRVEEERLPE